MSPLLRTVVALLLVLPVGAYAVGSLLVSDAAEPDQRRPIVIEGPPDVDATTRPAPTRAPRPSSTVPPRDDDADDGGGGGRDRDDDDDRGDPDRDDDEDRDDEDEDDDGGDGDGDDDD